MNRLPAFSVILVFAVLTIVGAGMVPLLNLQYSPSQKEGELSVSYAWNGAPAKLVESEVTSRLEGLIVSVSGVKSIESTSYKDWGRINVTLKDKNQIEQIRFEIATLLRQTYNKLPDGVSYPSISVATGGSNVEPILTYTINSELPTQQIEQYAQEYIVKELSLVEGINSVELSGATPFYQRLEFDPQQMRALGVSIGELVAAVRGFVSDYNLVGSVDQTGVLLTNNFSSDELASIPLKSSNGKIIRVGDVCSVEYKESLPTRYYRLNGLNTINITVYPQKGTNTIKACNAVKARMAQLEEDFPDNFSALAVSDISIDIQNEINKIIRRTVLSLLILLAFVYVTSRSFKYLLTIAGALLANILIAFIFYVLFGIEVHIYTMAGITTSFGIVIDTSIIMVAHYSYWRNRKVFLAILAALLTSIGSLIVIFLLPEQQQLVLRDFASVIMINLSVSLLIAMFLIPALVDKFGVQERQGKTTFRGLRRVARFNRFYGRYITFIRRWRWALMVLLVAGFAGSLYYFKENSKGNFYRSLERPNLYIKASLPQGCTIHQLNEIVLYMENYLSQFDEIEMFRTSITSASSATIVVAFRKDVEDSGFPLMLKDEVISKATDYGGANWSVYGIDEHGFSNNVNATSVGNRIIITGYSYDQVYGYCMDLARSLEQNRRVKDVQILTSTSWGARKQSEYFIDYNKKAMALYDVSAADTYSALQEQLYAQDAGTYYKDGVRTNIAVQSRGKESFDVWNLMNEYVQVGGKDIKFSQLGSVSKRDSGMEIYKKDQEYQMVVAFGYLGQIKQADRLIEREIERMNTSVLPVGFKAKKDSWSYGAFDDPNNIWMLLLVIAIIYFMCAVLFESLLLPLVIIFLIPLSFIGVFLVFGLSGWSFDQGGYASLIMLSGLVVNAGIYILHQYRSMLGAAGKTVGKRTLLQLYIKAFNNKIVPISLTVVSTVLGLIPFIMDGPDEVFWFAFAIGTMSGLLFSMLALVFVMPVWVDSHNSKYSSLACWILLCACNSRPSSYTVSGNLSEFLTSYGEGSIIDSAYIMCGDSIVGNKSAVASDGTFTLTGVVEAPVEAYLMADITVPGGKGKSARLFILENGNIVFNDIERGVFQGTPLNDAVYAETVWLQQATDNPELKLQRVSAFIEKYKNTPATAALFYYIAGTNIFSLDQKETLVNNANPCIMESDFVNEYVSSILSEQKRRKALVATREGEMFTDFEVECNGKTQRLSDFVGKGQYVLADFWASWCMPCRKEIPNLVKIYNKYKNKGLVVLGITVGDKQEYIHKAIEEMDIPYPQIINEGTIPGETYGIQGIPHIILFGPDGKILERGLRGAEIDKAVREYIR